MLKFSEAGGPLQPIPQWASFLINYGAMCQHVEPNRRRISIVSMPCDSAGAGLIALGAMVKRLTLPHADDSSAHFERLRRLAVHIPPVYVRHHEYRGLFKLTTENGQLWVTQTTALKGQSGPLRNRILPSQATAWRMDGEPPVQVAKGKRLQHSLIYDALIPSLPRILESNLSWSDSAICFAGRVTGEVASHSTLGALQFKKEGHAVDLARLLSIQNWSETEVSRMRFFNTRTSQFDRESALSSLVVVDGDLGFLRILGNDQFRDTDVTAVVSRTVERDRLELLGQKITEQAQWYEPDIERIKSLPSVPIGISVSALQRRRA